MTRRKSPRKRKTVNRLTYESLGGAVSIFESSNKPDVTKTKIGTTTKSKYLWPWPPCLPTLPEGHPKTGIVINSMLLGGNIDYYVANMIVPYLMRFGINTPNKVTYFNCLTFRVLAVAMNIMIARGELAFDHIWLCPIVWLVSNVFDAADGQMARRYGLGSEFGMWLDHTTDEAFGYCLVLSFLYLIYVHFGFYSFQMLGYFSICVFLGFFGKANINAKDAKTHYRDLSIRESIGLWVELSMDNITISAVWIPYIYYYYYYHTTS
jgi:phosphatidylglycerophosphate synthase